MTEQKPFLIIQLRPEDETADNEYEAILRHGGLAPTETERIRAEQAGLPEIDLTRYAGIIVGGSPFDISTPPEEKSELQQSLEQSFYRLFDEIVAIDFPFLGACSGNGLLGSYCGTPITREFGEPVGVVDVHLTEAAAEEPLLADFPATFPVLLGHKEACQKTPPGATLLVRGDACPVQMFRIKQNIFATQFHPEGDPEGFTVRINIYKHHGYFPPETAEELIERISQVETPHAQLLLRRFVERYRAA